MVLSLLLRILKYSQVRQLCG